MIMQRITVRIKAGKLDEALEVAKEGRKLSSFFPGRLYSSIYGPNNTVVFENEAENTTELDKFWEECAAKEEFAPWLARWHELEAEEGTTELWNLEDS